MKSYKDHLVSTNSSNNYLLRKPVFRSSAVFPVLYNKKLNTNIYFLGYWLIKRNIKEVNILVTIRNKSGTIIKRFNKLVNQVKSYSVNLKNEISNNKTTSFIGSIELEVFSTQDMVFPYPAFVINFDGVNSSSVVHSCGRIYNDQDDFKVNNQILVPETGFDITDKKKFNPFFSFVNGNEELKNSEIILDLVNYLGKEKTKKIKFKRIKPYETLFVDFLNKNDRDFFKNKKGTVRINHKFRSFFPRFLAGSLSRDKNDSSITHTYYDLSKKSDKTQYWKNPNSSKYYDSAIAVPIFNKKNLKTELAIYPNFSKIKFDLNLEVYNKKGVEVGKIFKFFKIDDKFKKPSYLNLNNLLKINRINLNKGEDYFCRLYTSSKREILSRLKFGLNIGNNNNLSNSIESNICFNAQVPVKAIHEKKGTFKWGLLKNRNNSQILLSNIGFIKGTFKSANISLKFWNEFDNKFLIKKICIPDRGNYFFSLNKNKKIKNFLKNNTGWVTVQSDNPFVNGWYLDISKNGSVGADHLF